MNSIMIGITSVGSCSNSFLCTYKHAQVMEALSCPVNRDATRKERNCDDLVLFDHPEWLVEHYIKYGGAAAFARRREELSFLIEKTRPDYEI